MLYTLSSIISTHHFYVFGTTPTGNGLQRIEPIACAQESGNWRILAPEKTWVGNADDWKIEAALGYSISEGFDIDYDALRRRILYTRIEILDILLGDPRTKINTIDIYRRGRSI